MTRISALVLPSNETNGWLIDPTKPCPGKKGNKKVRPHEVTSFVPIDEESLQVALLLVAFSNDKDAKKFFIRNERVIGFCRTKSIISLTYMEYNGEELNSCVLETEKGYVLQVTPGAIYDAPLSKEELKKLSSGEVITKWRTTTL